MLDAWGEHPVVRSTLDEASTALGEDMGKLIKEGPKEALAMTTNTQPVMLVSAVAAYRVWLAEVGVAPDAVAGHSLGEYSALVAAGVLTLEQAAPLVRFRAQAMQDAVPAGTGGMAAILGMDAVKIAEICAQITQSLGGEETVEAVNFNDPAQTVVAGSKKAVEAACEALKAAGAKRALPLPVSAPFHSRLMKPAADKLKEKLASLEFGTPKFPVIDNVDVSVRTTADEIKEALYRQAFGPVRWVECVHAIQARGVQAIVECGPGKVLAGMTKRIAPDLTGGSVYDMASLNEIKAALA